jgi:hypothetical protein
VSTIKTDALTSVTTNTDLTLSANGTGGVKVSDYFQLTKGADISSATSLTLGTDGNAFDITGTTTITSIATQGIGSHVTLHFDGALTFTHHSTDLILPGAANITTAAGDIAVMYEYASADWRCVSYSKASGAAVVAGGGLTIGAEVAITSGSSVTISSIPSDVKEVHLFIEASSMTAQHKEQYLEFGDSGGLETTGYLATLFYGTGTAVSAVAYSTTAAVIQNADGEAATNWNYVFDMYLKDETNNTWMWSYQGGTNASASNKIWWRGFGAKSLSGELTQISLATNGTWDGSGVVNISYM